MTTGTLATSERTAATRIGLITLNMKHTGKPVRETCTLGLTRRGLEPAYGLASEALSEETESTASPT